MSGSNVKSRASPNSVAKLVRDWSGTELGATPMCPTPMCPNRLGRSAKPSPTLPPTIARYAVGSSAPGNACMPRLSSVENIKSFRSKRFPRSTSAPSPAPEREGAASVFTSACTPMNDSALAGHVASTVPHTAAHPTTPVEPRNLRWDRDEGQPNHEPTRANEELELDMLLHLSLERGRARGNRHFEAKMPAPYPLSRHRQGRCAPVLRPATPGVRGALPL